MGLWGQRFYSLIFLILAVSLFLFSVVRPGSFEGMRSGAADIFAPVIAAVSWPVQEAANYARAVSGIAAMQAENAKLQQENEQLREWYQTALVLKTENKSLQRLLNIRLDPQLHYVTARVAADSGSSYARTILVLAGRRDNVQKGHAVISGEGVIGRVIETGNMTARILLVTDINSRVPVQVGESANRAILAGNNSDMPVLQHLGPDMMVAEGDRVVTSGDGGIFPYGLPVGIVVRGDNGGWAVRPLADIGKTTFVRVVEPEEDQNLRSVTPTGR